MPFFYWEWTPEQWAAYGIKTETSNALLVAFMVAITQYAVSQWIWFGSPRKPTNRPPHRAPVYLMSLVVFGYVWSTMVDFFLAGRTVPLGTQIAMPLVVLAGAPANLLFCWAWTKVFPPEDDAKKNDDDNDAEKEQEELDVMVGVAAPKEHAATDPNKDGIEIQSEQLEAGIPAAKNTDEIAGSTKKPSIAYMNNIKIYLTFLVILHHCATYLGVGASTGFIAIWPDNANSVANKVMLSAITTNQSFFMNLFFFISGYFVPRSLDKKGAYFFLTERAKRLGIPFVVYTFLLGPICKRVYWRIFYVGTNELPLNTIFFEDGPMWFLGHLIVLGTAYTFLCGSGWSPKIACPSLLGFLGIGTVVGLLAALLSLAFPPVNILTVPLFLKFYLGYVMFFFGGALASRNNWMESIKAMPRVPIYGLAFICFGLIVAMTFFRSSWPMWVGEVFYSVTCCGGWCTMVFSLTVTVFFMDFLDRAYAVTDFFAKSMYTAYIIHMAVTIPLAAAILVAVLKAAGVVVFTEAEGLGEFYLIVGGGNYHFAAFIFLVVVAMAFTWPLAYGIRSIPGFSQVL